MCCLSSMLEVYINDYYFRETVSVWQIENYCK